MRSPRTDARGALLALLATLLFLGALRAFLPLVYYGNLVALGLQPSALFVLLLLSPVLLWLPVPRRTLAIAGAVALVAGRVVLPFARGTDAAVALAGLAAGGFFLLLPLMREARAAAAGAALGLALDAALRWWALSWDPTQGVRGLFLVLPLGTLLLLLAIQTEGDDEATQRRRKGDGDEPSSSAPGRRLVVASSSPFAVGLGLGFWIFLEAAILGSPYVVARWNDLPGPLTAAIVVAGLVGAALFVARAPEPKRLHLVALHAPIALFLADHLFLHSELVPVWAALSQPALVLDLARLVARLMEGRQAGALLVAALVVLVAHFVYAFSYLFAYVPGGAMWEGAELWLLPGAALAVAAVALGRAGPLARAPAREMRALAPLLLAPVLVGLFAGFGGSAEAVAPRDDEVVLLSFNVHQGFDNEGTLDPEVFVAVLREIDADIVALQEAETTRFTSADLDLVGLLAARAGYAHTAVQAASAQGFGGAILSRHAIEKAEVHALPGSKDHRLYTEAVLDVHGRLVTLYSVHLGLPAADREAQTDAILADAAERSGPIILAGDWNSCPESPCARDDEPQDDVYATITRSFGDAWVLAGHAATGPEGHTYDAADPHQRIDHVYVSRDITVISAEVIRTPAALRASDHLPVMVRMRV